MNSATKIMLTSQNIFEKTLTVLDAVSLDRDYWSKNPIDLTQINIELQVKLAPQ